MFTIHLAKEPFKFSCSHFTILSADRAERLHGHNYQVRLDIAVNDDKIDPALGFAFDFNAAKPFIRKFCDELDERILLPLHSPYLQVRTSTESVDVRFGKKQYVFPAEDTLCLPLSNITSEELARFTCLRLFADLQFLPQWKSLQVHVEETRGQSVSYQKAR